MRALILAAGMGNRLLPYTKDNPKCLVKLAGKSLLERQVSIMKKSGITEIHVVGGYMAGAIRDLGYRMFINKDYDKTNMVETLFCAGDIILGDMDLIIAYGDIVYEKKVLDALISCDEAVCLAVDRKWRRYWEARMDDPLEDAETLKMDGNGMIRELGKKPRGYDEIQAQYMGLIKVRADYALRLKEVHESMNPKGIYDGKDYRNMYMTSFLQHLIDIGWPVCGVQVDNGWLEIDTKDELELYNRMQEEGKLRKFCRVD